MAQTCAKLESNAVVVGIDVSKDHLDAAQYPSGDLIQTSNDTKGLRTLLRWIGRQRAVHVIFEATGPFHRQLESHLAKASIPFSRINPRHARKFAEATGKLAKTDRVDAVMLAKMGALLEPRTSDICNEQQSALQELAAARRNLIRDRTALLNRQQNLQLSLLKRLTRYRLRQIEAQIAAIDQAISELISTDGSLSRKRAILVSIPGIGETTAAMLIFLNWEHWKMDRLLRSQVWLLSQDSQESGRVKSFIRDDRIHVRNTLYMPALVAMRHNPDLPSI
ncbi:IS110 family transposase [Acetobacter senegalensis]|nr:transposase [Acetobacter senegalensis]